MSIFQLEDRVFVPAWRSWGTVIRTGDGTVNVLLDRDHHAYTFTTSAVTRTAPADQRPGWAQLPGRPEDRPAVCTHVHVITDRGCRGIVTVAQAAERLAGLAGLEAADLTVDLEAGTAFTCDTSDFFPVGGPHGSPVDLPILHAAPGPLRPIAEAAVHAAFHTLISETDDGPELNTYRTLHSLRYPDCCLSMGCDRDHDHRNTEVIG